MASKKAVKEEKTIKEKVVKEKDNWDVLIYPHLTEKSMNMVELENKLVFIVNKKSNKKTIREAVESEFDVKVVWVRTEITTRGQKKAVVKISPDFSASDIASKLGMI
ncbi:MAG: 50S ribosomal protein L23 [Candidatus Aenigmarchaeota archaeon]|nr:50S ribosomal protein L23 [Candidatus Aenigmarchaeota archaeon]